MDSKLLNKKLKAAVIGHLIGDALGVPVEFKSRKYLKENPVKSMQGFAQYNLPPGSWSDDGSLTLCLLESLAVKGYDLNDLADRFVSWLYEGHLTPTGEAFGVGRTTETAVSRLKSGVLPFEAGPNGERDNGNGSLMRILPLAFYLLENDPEDRFKAVEEVSSLTHGHPRAVLACYIYTDFSIRLIKGENIEDAYLECCSHVEDFLAAGRYGRYGKYKEELKYYRRIIKEDTAELNEGQINSTAYVVDTLEAFFWVLLNSSSYREAVLMAVNLGLDTDTTAAVTGGPAAIYYGFEDIPKKWIDQLRHKKEIIALIDKFSF
ncbi:MULTISPECIES: ADP-ribosylglycohydrolase family protein [unclassified Halanaerobium]|uniref:ADP-ribosylglycohydrolase family protein n=1 Tax=unclassified Halanaerobium TaxID=2641197 RepID=UPI000DF38659|nr:MULTISPECIES: ADP-ribosylglycohydrolase family protein [unclassified Halanaerobium]RCW43854.1 ADP-ribosylglycohydrolase [Halanaerobium sp. MA284_MarDTE_T2]RCW80840.1 ADP-ribosylglycohydrolase [Halanaerobium sp. DL-01]